MSGTTLRLHERLRLTKRFAAVRREGARVRGALLSVWALPNALAVTRLGLRTQHGIRGGVARNRARRLVREAFRLHKARVKPGYDIVAVIHQTSERCAGQFQDELLRALETLSLFSRGEADAPSGGISSSSNS